MSWFTLEPREFESRLIDQLDSYWRRKAGDRAMPSRGDVDPIDLVPLLPYVVLTAFEPEPFRVRYRLVGTHVVAQSQRDVTGCYLDELTMNPDAVDFESVYRAVAQAGTPAFGMSRISSVGDATMGFYFAVYPLSQDGETVTHGIAVHDYRNVEELDDTR